MRVLAILAILTTVALAGCASEKPELDLAGPHPDPAYTLDDLSEKVFDILPVVEEWITMDDGERMHNAVYRPDTNQTVPVFINFSPYWGDTAELGGDAFSQYMIDEYVPRGYAVVLTALRGTGHSEGCFSIGGDRELRDMHEVVDHYADVDWSNGNIATGGKSYDSSPTNGLIAKFPHPALKGVFHVSGITDMYAYNYKGGVPYTTGPVFNTYYYLQGTDEYGVSLVGAGSPMDEDAESLARLVDDVACPDLPFVQAHGVGSGVTGMKTDYWVERDWTQFIGDSDWNGSIFFVHGLQDWNVKPDHILPWIDNLPEQIRVKGWLHQGGHVYPEREDWNQTMLRWMDAELKGTETGFWDEPRWEVRSDDGDWYQHEAWPPEFGRYYGVTHTGAGGTSGGAMLIKGDMHVSGGLLLTANVTAQFPDSTLVVSIYDETPAGRTWVTEGLIRLVYRDGLEIPKPYTRGQVMQVAIHTFPADHVFQANSTLIVAFNETPRNGVLTDAQVSVDVRDFQLSIPVAYGDAMADQPADMRCFAC